MFPSSPNIRLTLLKLENRQDEIGNRILHVLSSKEVIGINFSVTSREFYESKKQDIRIDLAIKIQSFLYDGSRHVIIQGTVYNIERTYGVGQFIELYLVASDIHLGDIDGYTG